MFKKTKKTIAALIVASGFLFAPAAQAVIVPADIVYVVDYSGSMGGDIAQVIANIGDFQTALTAAGIDARYGAVRFGSSISPDPNLLTDLTDAAGVSAALSGFPIGGGVEPGSLATTFALNNITWRGGAVKNIILITDEDDDSSLAQFQEADALLTRNNALFNAIGVPGVGNSDSRYGVLTANHGGTFFNINDFRNNPAAFLANFNATKVREILQTPEPSIMALLGIGIAGIGFASRRRAIA